MIGMGKWEARKRMPSTVEGLFMDAWSHVDLPSKELLSIAHAFPKRDLLGHRNAMGTTGLLTNLSFQKCEGFG